MTTVLAGCGPTGEAPLVVATSWPLEARVEVASADLGSIVWVEVAPGESLSSVVDRRGGVDLILGGPVSEFARLAGSGRLVPINPTDPSPWRSVRRPGEEKEPGPTAGPPTDFGDPRDDPAALAKAKAELRAEGWPKGYEGLVRRSALARPRFCPSSVKPLAEAEAAALIRGGRNPDRARRLLRGFARPSADGATSEALADGLLADLLGSALVDAHEELRDAEDALRRFGHPARAEGSIGERPPWPPASVVRLLAGPGGAGLVETLAEQVAPEPEARAWLLRSWKGSKRVVDGDLLAELAGAAGGRLAREPRFRAWLRGEWTAWTRQLGRRVARLARGYVPS